MFTMRRGKTWALSPQMGRVIMTVEPPLVFRFIDWMKAIQQLKQEAALKRDALIDAAKAEYNETIQKISEIETRLVGKQRRRGSRRDKIRLVDLIFDHLPNDRPFSFADVEGILEANSRGRNFAKSSINVTVNRMLKAGDIKRVRHSKPGQPALFALPDVQVSEAKTLVEWAMEIDGWKEMEPVELMVRMTENGYELENDPNQAVASLKREISKYVGGNDS